MALSNSSISSFGKWMALTAAILGWMFDGLEMGLFPLIAGPALGELVSASDTPVEVDKWLGIITALFLVGAATGGVLFGWLGDRLGRVRSMMLSVLTYALVSGLCAFANEPWHLGALRFVAALGMGGEWSLGVALINEIWPDRSRVLLAGLIGAAANLGYLLIGAVGLHLDAVRANLGDGLLTLGLPQSWVASLMAHEGWRLLMTFGAAPALLTFFIRLCVPESERWLRQRVRGATSFWLTRDLTGVLLGALGACGIILLWSVAVPLPVRFVGTAFGLTLALGGYLYPVVRYLQRAAGDSPGSQSWRPTLRLMLLAACLSGVALLGTWGSTQQAPTFAWNLAGRTGQANKYTQIWTALGAVVGTPLAALLAQGIGRRLAYSVLCLGSLVIIPAFFLSCKAYDDRLLFLGFLMGGITASFYGWLPLYLPELFPTTVRATGQGFGFNFGRVLAAMGVLQLGNIQQLMQPFAWGLAEVCASLSIVYVIGLVLIWFAPETKGKPLPE